MSKTQLLTTKQAAEALNLSPRSLEKWRLDGCGPPFVKLGGSVRYRSVDLGAWVQERVRRSTSDPGPGQEAA